MYRMDRQMRIEDFTFPFGQLDAENEWVKLAEIVPWDEAEEQYARQFVNNGHPAHSARIALGAPSSSRSSSAAMNGRFATSAGNIFLRHRHCVAVHESCEETSVSFAANFAVR